MALLRSQDTSSAHLPVISKPVAFSADVKTEPETEDNNEESHQDISVPENYVNDQEAVRNSGVTNTLNMKFLVRVKVKHETEEQQLKELKKPNSKEKQGNNGSVHLNAAQTEDLSHRVVCDLGDTDVISDHVLKQIVDGCFVKLLRLKLLRCDMCLNVFHKRSQLVAHIVDHHTGNTDAIESVEEVNENNIAEELNTFDLKLYPCNICHEQFAFKTSLKIHKMKHMGKEPFTCDICEKEFHSKKNLVNHLDIHFNGKLSDPSGKPNQCEMCNKIFTNRIKFKQHMRRHYRLKRFACKICQSAFTVKSNLMVHYRVHTGERPYECSICNKKFSYKSYLNVHYGTHSGHNHIRARDYPKYTCDICKKEFKGYTYFKRHKETHGDKKYSCDHCDKSFALKKYLKQHMNLHTHAEAYVCEICNKSFSTKSYLAIHNRTHTGKLSFVCEICNTAFNRRCYLTRHMMYHTGEKPHVCDICNKAFRQKSDLNVHIRIHMGVRPFKCEFCTRAFNHKSNLTTHIRKSH